MPVYNGERFLAEALESLLGQTFGDFELIISNNASTDGTEEICRAFEARDSRIFYCRSDRNLGGGWNHNRVLELAQAEYFKWASHDDLCAPTFLEACVGALDLDRTAVLSHPRTQFIDESGSYVGTYNLELDTESSVVSRRFQDLVMSYHQCYQIYGVIRRDILQKTGPMGNFVNGDGVLLAHIALFGTYHKIPEHLFRSRRHPGQSSRTPPSRLCPRRFRLTNRVNGMPCTEWWDPSKKRALTFPQWRQLREFSRCIRNSPLNLQDQASCYAVLAQWTARDRRRYVKDILIAVDQLIDNLFAPSEGRVDDLKAGGETT
jgi:glycosyltransferase involved in cell wall biosynthesis